MTTPPPLRRVPCRVDKWLRDSTPLFGPEVALALGRGGVVIEVAGAAPSSTSDTSALVFDGDRVELDGVRVEPRARQTVALLNKPARVTCTTRDPDGRADLAPWLADLPPGTFPVGRLDRDTTGLLLLTTDGDLAAALLHPEHHVEKRYWLWIDESLAADDPRLARLRAGVELTPGVVAHATRVEVQARTEHATELCVSLAQGLNRQVRRMCRVVDLRLIHLHRASIGPLALGAVPTGGVRILEGAEVEALWQAAGGRALVRARQVSALTLRAVRSRREGHPDPRLEQWLAADAP